MITIQKNIDETYQKVDLWFNIEQILKISKKALGIQVSRV